MRQTSIEVYNRIKAEGLLTKLKLDVYEVLLHQGPLTGKEVWKVLHNQRRVQIDSIRPRFAELDSMGAIRNIGTRRCRESLNNEAIVWDVTDQIPRRLDKEIKESSKQKIARLENEIRLLTKTNEKLTRQVANLRDAFDVGET